MSLIIPAASAAMLIFFFIAFGAALLVLNPEVPLVEKFSPWLEIADSIHFWASLPRRTYRLLLRFARYVRSEVFAPICWR